MSKKQDDEIKLIYPWTAGTMVADRTVKANILQELRLQYPGVMGRPRPEHQTMVALRSLAETLVMRERTGKVPWILCVCSSLSVLQTLAQLLPAVMALTFHVRPINVTTDSLVNLFAQPAPKDDFVPDPAGESIHRVKNRGLLVWENFSEKKKGGDQFASMFMSVLGYRLEKRKMTVFMCPTTAVSVISSENVSSILVRIEQSVGPNIPSLLREAAEWKYLKVKADVFRIKTEAL